MKKKIKKCCANCGISLHCEGYKGKFCSQCENNPIEMARYKIESKGGIVCDNFEKCHNRATRNIQESIITWSVSATGNYSKYPIDYQETNGDNNHFCNDCEY